MKKVILTILFFQVIILSQGYGSVGVSDAIAAGMGNTYTSNVTGIYAVGKNPANITLDRNINVEFAAILPFPNVGIYAGTDFINVNDINYFFGGVTNEQGKKVGRYLTENDKERLKKLFEQGGMTSGIISANLFNIIINGGRDAGTFGFSINDNAASFFDLPESIIDLALEGNPVGDVYNFGDSKMDAVWIRDYTFSYSRDFRDLIRGFRNFNVGFSLRIIQGFAMAKTDYVKTTLETGENSELIINGDYRAYAAFSDDFNIEYDFDSTKTDSENKFSVFPSSAGSGIGFDFGIATQVDDKWKLAASVTGIGHVKWNKNVAEYSSGEAIIIDDITDKDELDSLWDKVKGEGKYISEVKTDLPLVLRIGASLEVHKLFGKHTFPGTMTAAIDYNQGFNNTAMGTKKGRVSLGVEWRPAKVIPLRTGFSFGGRLGFAWSLGTGIDLGLFEFNIAAFNFESLVAANSAKKASLAIGSRWRL